jgi:head-tail adaptor
MMSTSFDPSADLADIVDGLEPITLRRRGSSATEVAHALRRQVATRLAAINSGRMSGADVRWYVPRAECPAAPHPGDAIVDAGGNRWTVLDVNQTTLCARWECTCRDLAAAYRLHDTITVEQAETTAGPDGGSVTLWRTWQTGIRARIQPLATVVNAAADPPTAVKTSRIYLAEELPLDQRYRIRAADGTLYGVTGYTAAATPGNLPVVDVEEA